MHTLFVVTRWLSVVAFLTALLAPPAPQLSAARGDEAHAAVQLAAAAKAVERALDQLPVRRVAGSDARLPERPKPPTRSDREAFRDLRGVIRPEASIRPNELDRDLRADIRRTRFGSHFPHLGDDPPAI